VSDAPAKPKGIDVGTLASLLNLTPRRVQQLANEEVIPKASHGRYPLVGAVRGYVSYLQGQAKGGTPASIAAELAQLRLARARLGLQRDEMDFASDAGQLVNPDDCLVAVSSVVEATRTVMQLVPRRHGTDAEDRARLKRICTEVLAACIDRAQMAMQVLTGEAAAMPDDELAEAASAATEALEANGLLDDEDTPDDEVLDEVEEA
jgi:phage terminase Nu1 subunit (DNA packaging protein)